MSEHAETPYIHRFTDLAEGRYYGLPHEVEALRNQVKDLQLKRGALSVHIGEAMEQSSETWHDNAPADALFGEMLQLDTREAALVKAARFLIETPYPDETVTYVTIGSRVLVAMGSDEFYLDVTGNIPLSQTSTDDIEKASIDAPIAQALIGGTVGSTVVATVGEQQLEIAIKALDQTAQSVQKPE